VTTFAKAIQSNGELQYEAQIDHLRHAKFAGIREDKDTRTVIKEHGGEG